MQRLRLLLVVAANACAISGGDGDLLLRADGGAAADLAGGVDGGGADAALVADATVDLAAARDAMLPDASLACPPPGPIDCSPGSGTGTGTQCFDAPSCYLGRVQAAVRASINDHPEWFDFVSNPNCAVIVDVDSYMNAVVASLVAGGVCAMRDPNAPGEEVTVKHDNAWSENFDIVASTGCARYGALIYTGVCSPAWW